MTVSPSLHRMHCDNPADVASASAAWRAAAAAGSALLVTVGAVAPGDDEVAALGAALARDPMFGVAAARVTADRQRAWLRPLDPGRGDPALRLYPARILDELPDHYVPVAWLSPCMLFRPDLLAALPELDRSMPSLAGALALQLHRARRLGFRVVVANDARVADPGDAAARLSLGEAERARVEAAVADAARVHRLGARLPEHTIEAFLGRVRHPDPRASRSLVLDASGLSAKWNGTTEAILALLEAFDRVADGWTTAAVVPADARAAFDLDRRLARTTLLAHPVRDRFAIGLRLNQPWALGQLVSLHRMAWRCLFLIHDTIAWDTVYPAPADLDPAWRLMASTADGVVFNSDWSRDRFRARFGAAGDGGAAALVSRFPTGPEPYRPGAREPGTDGRFVFVVGGRADHKAMAPAVRAIAAAFPGLELVALGHRDPAVAGLTGLLGGDIPQSRIDGLYAHAAAVVFPSLYEGFGFPVLRGLAAGTPVLARDTALLGELADHIPGPGRLIPFRTDDEMVARLGALLDGGDPPALELGGSLGDGTTNLDWDAVARRLLDGFAALVDRPEDGRWHRREDAFRALIAFHEEILARERADPGGRR